jgi:hypothetical protein
MTIPSVRKTEDGTVYLCDGVTAAFFLPTPLDASADAVLAAFELYLQHVPDKVLRWCSLGADSEEYRAVDGKTIGRCKALLSKESARKRKLTAFEIVDGARAGDAATNGFGVLGNPVDRRAPLERNLVQVYFPSESVATAAKADRLVGMINEIAASLPFVYAYASPALHWARSMPVEAFADAQAVAKRYPGFDVQNNELTRTDIGTKTRGARWLTLLGPELIKKVGGMKKVGALAGSDVDVAEVGHGIAIRAGRQPEVGDRNRKVGAPLLRKVAKLLEPVTLFDEPALGESVFGEDDPAFFEAWEKRFLTS